VTAIRALMITGEYPPHPGGIAGYTQLLRDGLARQDVEVFVMSSEGSEAEVTVRNWSWRSVPAIRAAIDTHSIDLVHIQYQAGAYRMHPVINALPTLIREVPVVTTFHDLRPPYLFPKAGKLRFLVMRRMARWSDAVVVTNPTDARLLREPGIDSDQIPLGPSLPVPDPDVAPAGSVGFFGFPSRQKGFDILIEALSQIDEARRPALTIVGGKPPSPGHHGFFSEEDVASRARLNRVDVHWTGFLEPQQASNALAACSALVFPFPHGATQRSSALIAALRSGRPVITTEAARDNDLGSLAGLPQTVTLPAASPEIVASAIQASITCPPSWTPLPPEYEWDSIASRHRNLYRDLLEKTHS
jgi:glycosyltransferase involved in cell wall biosynthesis